MAYRMADGGFRNAQAAFCGAWHVRRSIFDQLTSSSAGFEGQAVIAPSLFEEHGTLSANGMALQSSRTYHLDLEDSRLVVRFADLREFVCIGDAAFQSLTHLCGDDFYQGRLAFLSTDRWVESWRVCGPRKHYRSIAFYQRV